MLSVIIPTINAEAHLHQTLQSVGEDVQVLVVDGGSTDNTLLIANEARAQVFSVEPGRGRQLAMGADKASGPWLLFLHADTTLPKDWQVLAQAFMDDPLNARRAAYFWLGFDDNSTGANRVAALANWRAQTFGLPYGDQGLLIHKDFYTEVGGFHPDQHLMEDVDLVRRIGPMRLKRLHGTVTTSAERYRRTGWWARPLKNLLCLSLYLIGAPKSWYQRLYG
ncbi:TIGR04283 family arsenosugar biosynthesis glycosyltransferase [Magnetovibrio sp. PR-2]|uniref:TIGR04283 family arsenosugar biosynthesis glycosyltransferase n=1 Tax=Magnetovibrio sp. PR-2 TaxID=3120356 RepID=UPI002FCE5A04